MHNSPHLGMKCRKKQLITKIPDQNQDANSPHLFNLHWSNDSFGKKRKSFDFTSFFFFYWPSVDTKEGNWLFLRADSLSFLLGSCVSLVTNGEVASLEHKGKVSVNCKSMFVTWKSFGTFLSKVHGNHKTILKKDLEATLSKNAPTQRDLLVKSSLQWSDQESELLCSQTGVQKYTTASADEAVSLLWKCISLRFAELSLCFIRVN